MPIYESSPSEEMKYYTLPNGPVDHPVPADGPRKLSDISGFSCCAAGSHSRYRIINNLSVAT